MLDQLWTTQRIISMALILAAVGVSIWLLRLSYQKPKSESYPPTCPKCKYNMSHLDRLECPECGHEVNSSAEWAHHLPRRIKIIPRITAGVLLAWSAETSYFAMQYMFELNTISSLSQAPNIDSEVGNPGPTLYRSPLGSAPDILGEIPNSDIWYCRSIPWYLTPIPWAKRTRYVTSMSPISDQDLAVLCSLSELTKLRVDGSALTDAGLSSLKNARSLRKIILFRMTIDDRNIKFIAEMPALEELNLSGREGVKEWDGSYSNRIQGPGLKYLVNMKSLRSLNLSGAKVSDDSLGFISKIPNLTTLILDRTDVKGPGLASLKNAESLKHISLADTSVNDDCIEFLSRIPNLESANLDKTNFSTSGVARLQSLSRLREVAFFEKR